MIIEIDFTKWAETKATLKIPQIEQLLFVKKASLPDSGY